MVSALKNLLGDYFPFEVTVILITLTTVLLVLRSRQRRLALPGPLSLPIIGNFFQLGDQVHISLTEMRKVYGDVFHIKMGMVPIVVVSGSDTVRKVLGKQGEQFADRPNMYSFSLPANGQSMTFSEKYSEAWKVHKKIMKNALRSFSNEEASSSNCSCRLEEYISAEASELVNSMTELSAKQGSFNPFPLVTITIANVVCALCFGKRYNHHDKEFLKIVELNHDLQRVAGAGLLADFIPFLKYFPSSALNELKKFIGTLNDFIAKSVQDHYESHDENNIRDITDALIQLCKSRNTVDKHHRLTDEQIVVSVNDIFGAGFETIISGLMWCILYLLKYPDIQDKIHKEIDENIGISRSPRFDDRKVLHYTEAFINEVLRHSSFVPFTIPHWAVWKDADLFIPERFLDEAGHIDKNLQDKVLIFGMGVRKCVGEDLARNEMFIILTSLLQRLHLVKEPGHIVDFIPIFGLSMKPKPYNLKIEIRA